MAASSAPVRNRTIDVLPDCVLPSSQNTGAGVLVRRSASAASRSGGGPESPLTVRFTASQNRLMASPVGSGQWAVDRKKSQNAAFLPAFCPLPTAHRPPLFPLDFFFSQRYRVRSSYSGTGAVRQMDGGFSSLKLFADEPAGSSDHTPLPAGGSNVSQPRPDPHTAATRELIRPPTVRRGRRECEPFSAAWFEELEQKRYQRHGAWLPRALEFGRHPGESLLSLGCGLGTDAVSYALTGTTVTIATGPDEHAELIRDNISRHGIEAAFATLDGPALPFADGKFDVVAWNALYDADAPNPLRIAELFRVLKPGGKLIGLFPARFDAAFWQTRSSRSRGCGGAARRTPRPLRKPPPASCAARSTGSPNTASASGTCAAANCRTPGASSRSCC
jgi:SAM-dependent methyltransferase